MIRLKLEDASIGLILEGLSVMSEEASVNADEGEYKRITDLQDEIDHQRRNQWLYGSQS